MAGDSISLVIPVYNDPQGIRTTLDSVLEHTAVPVEILVVDNASTDETPRIIDEYATRYDPVIHLTEDSVQSSYAARNTGLERANGELICFLDADIEVESEWLETAIDEINDSDAQYLAPNIELKTRPRASLASRYNETSGFPVEQFIEKHHYAPTACLFVTRELLDDVGTFDDRLVSGGDMEFGNRVHAAGYELHYAPELTVYHPTRKSFESLITRNIRIGRGHCQLQRYYPDRYGRVGIPPRPSSIRLDTYDASMHRVVFTLITIFMTGTRGLGYYRECLTILGQKIR